ncbi:hypothetical protein [Neptuniibacter sp. QD48_11]|uniref:hypothetical protein n=1 Tax=Neptuniibacter sp. QD48_11 TaxID=3398211 RepID=UPI0039F563A8
MDKEKNIIDSFCESVRVLEIIEKVESQIRLQEFVYCLYRNEEYKLSKLKGMDDENRGIAIKILEDIYPENIFGDLERFN